jgi:hypothetical protein
MTDGLSPLFNPACVQRPTQAIWEVGDALEATGSDPVVF